MATLKQDWRNAYDKLAYLSTFKGIANKKWLIEQLEELLEELQKEGSDEQ